MKAALITLALAAGLAQPQTTVTAQPRRDTERNDWRNLKNSSDFLAQLGDYSLANAPLTREDRAQIYQAIDNEVVHGDFTGQPDAERKSVLGSSVGRIRLKAGAAEQILVRGPLDLCGVAGWNCPLWIFVRQEGTLRVALHSDGNGLFARKTLHAGLPDLFTTSHYGASERVFGVYQWNGAVYTLTDCYTVKYSPDNPGKAPTVEGCEASPR